MASIPDDQLLILEIVLAGNISQTGVNTKNVDFVFHFRRIATTIPLSKGALESVFQTNFAVPFLAQLNAAYTQVSNKVRCVNDATDAPLTVARAIAGGVMGDQQQNFDTLVVQLKTGFRGKSGRGSKHFAPLSAADTLGNTLVAGTVTAWNLLVPKFYTNFTDSLGNAWAPCILSRKLSQLKTNPTTVVTNDITSALLNKTTGTMRRRKVATVTA